MTVQYAHLLGRVFDYGTTDCFDLLRVAYRENFNIDLPNYARPTDFWNHGLNLYEDKAFQNGFVQLSCHPTEYQEGDIVLMAINSSIGNHAGMLVGGGLILHHLWNRLSSADPYRGLWKNSTLGVYRHKDVVLVNDITTTNMIDYATPQTRKKLSDLG